MDNFFDQTVRNNLVTSDGTWKIATGQEDDYTTGCLLNYTYFKDYDKMIAVNLSKQQLDADPKVIQIKQQLQQCFSILKRQQELH